MSFPVYEESHYQATDNKTRPATLARISLEDISSAGWELHWDTAAGVAQEAKQPSGHGHENVPLGDGVRFVGLNGVLRLPTPHPGKCSQSILCSSKR